MTTTIEDDGTHHMKICFKMDDQQMAQVNLHISAGWSEPFAGHKCQTQALEYQ